MDTLAFKESELEAMKNAVEQYTVSIEDEITKIKNFEIGDSAGIYGGDQVLTVDNYINTTCKEIGDIVRYFDDFKEKLKLVKEAYALKQAAIKTGTVETAKPADPSNLVTVNFDD